MADLFYLILLLSGLLSASAFFSGTESTLFSLTPPDLAEISKKNKKIFGIINYLLGKPNNLYISILFGNMAVNITITILTTIFLMKKFAHYGETLTIIVITPLILLFGEIFPKLIGINNSVRISLFSSYPIYLFYKLITPIRYLLSLYTKLIFIVFRVKEHSIRKIKSRDLIEAFKISARDGKIDQHEMDMISGIIQLYKQDIEAIMTPRTELTIVSEKIEVKELLKKIKKNDKIILTYKASTDKITGYIKVVDLAEAKIGLKKIKKITTLIKPIAFMPKGIKIKKIFVKMKKDKKEIFIIIDEYGTPLGAVTKEDILQSISGNFFSGKLKKDMRSHNSIIIKGSMLLDEVNYRFGTEFYSEHSDTIGGYITEKLGKMPHKNDKIRVNNIELKILRVREHRIVSLELTINADFKNIGSRLIK